MNKQTTIIQTTDAKLIELLSTQHLIQEISESHYSLETKFLTERDYYKFLNEIRANHHISKIKCQQEPF